jgi:hypothetical protein
MIIKKLIWDEWNITHIARHNVLPGEVEDVCNGIFRSYESYDGRFEIIGETRQKRILLIVLDPEPVEGEYYVVTSHTGNKKDRKLYMKEKGGENNDTKKK